MTQFRNYPALTWRPEGRISVIYGPNASGKTNLLEAVSMLVPGRGLRGARNAELACQGELCERSRDRLGGPSGGWAVAGRFASATAGQLDIGTGSPPDGAADRRVFRLDGKPPRSQAEIAERVAAVWLTPQMDRLFQGGSAARRRFLDRLVYALEPAHAREMGAHMTALAQRNRLLAQAGAGGRAGGRTDWAWLAALEDSLARHAVAATAARLGLVARLNAAQDRGAADPFPAVQVRLLCPIADRLAGQPALQAEDWLRDALAAQRAADARTGSTSLGAHRTDLSITDSAGTPAQAASTGQQKTLLVGLILRHAALIAQARGFAPMLLLDEPAVHLDQTRRAALFAALAGLPAQVLLTGTDADVFYPLGDAAVFFCTGNATLRRQNPPAGTGTESL